MPIFPGFMRSRRAEAKVQRYKQRMLQAPLVRAPTNQPAVRQYLNALMAEARRNAVLRPANVATLQAYRGTVERTRLAGYAQRRQNSAAARELVQRTASLVARERRQDSLRRAEQAELNRRLAALRR